jgi:hypothetical protein
MLERKKINKISIYLSKNEKKNCQRKTIGLKMKPIQKDILLAL